MLTERQQTVYDWINYDLELPVYAEAYKGALEQLNKKSAGYITFVSHAGRDIMNLLADSVNSVTADRTQYVDLVNDFQDEWENKWGGDEFHPADDVPKEHIIPHYICEKVKKLVDEHKKGRLRAEEKDSSFFTTFLDYADKENIPENLSQEWEQAIKWFRGHAHLREDEFPIAASNEVEKHFQNLDNLLYAAAGSELEQLRSIHEILEEANE